MISFSEVRARYFLSYQKAIQIFSELLTRCESPKQENQHYLRKITSHSVALQENGTFLWKSHQRQKSAKNLRKVDVFTQNHSQIDRREGISTQHRHHWVDLAIITVTGSMEPKRWMSLTWMRLVEN